MSDKQYMSAIGFIQFDVKSRTANNKPVREIAIKAMGSNKLVNGTVWDQHDDIPLAKGDLVAIEGEYRQNVSGDKTYHNLSVRLLVKLGTGAGKPVGVANASASAPAQDDGDEDVPF